MAGTETDALELSWTGALGDRRYAFVRASATKAVQVDFPWFTARNYPQLVRYVPGVLGGAQRDDEVLCITSPTGDRMLLESDALRVQLEEAAGESLFLLRLGRGTYDSLPLSLLSVASIAALGQRLGLPNIAVERFRPNIVVKPVDPRDGIEDEWIEASVAFGDHVDGPRVRVVRPIKRCVMVNIDPITAERDPRFLKDIAKHKAANFGVHAVIERPGTIRGGDAVWLERGGLPDDRDGKEPR